MSDEIDPEIAALIGGNVEQYRPGGKAPALPFAGGPLPPDFDTLFGELGVTAEVKNKGEFGVDLSRKGFAPVEKTEEESSTDYFSDPEYYKKALGGEGEEATRFHEILSKYMKATDIKDKGVYRQQLISAYWYLAAKVALRDRSLSLARAGHLWDTQYNWRTPCRRLF